MTEKQSGAGEEVDQAEGVNSEQSTERENGSEESKQAYHEDFPTLELTLEEARRKYDDEERRREAVENKIGIVVTVDALLISFGILVSQSLNPIMTIFVFFPALVSAGLGLYTIRSRDYDRPGKNIVDFHDYSDYDKIAAQQEKHLLDYELTIESNKKTNDPKYSAFNYCIVLTFVSLALLLISLIANEIGAFGYILQKVKAWAALFASTAG